MERDVPLPTLGGEPETSRSFGTAATPVLGHNVTSDSEGNQTDPKDVDTDWKARFLVRWRRVPTSVRKTVVLVVGATLLSIGGVLAILPGPFTLPFVIAALAVLASEFVWAERIFQKGQDVTAHVVGRVRRIPVWIIVIVALFVVAGISATGYWWFEHRT